MMRAPSWGRTEPRPILLPEPLARQGGQSPDFFLLSSCGQTMTISQATGAGVFLSLALLFPDLLMSLTREIPMQSDGPRHLTPLPPRSRA